MTLPFLPQAQHASDDSHWISLSDIMTGLMMIFLVISICFMIELDEKQKQSNSAVISYKATKQELFEELSEEFSGDLKKWKGTLEKDTLIVRFQDPEILFESGKDSITNEFKIILNDFIPRYFQILTKEKYIDNVQEIRIEGHTSSEWSSEPNGDIAYLKNMALSQDRTRSVLEYILGLRTVKHHKIMIRKFLTANGLSSSRPIKLNNLENKTLSRRVEFRIVTNSERLVEELFTNSNYSTEEDSLS
tara:strand:+ start:8436 stop:9176 length:741 start_codon:yes stop_codon:yes gene_type:complete